MAPPEGILRIFLTADATFRPLRLAVFGHRAASIFGGLACLFGEARKTFPAALDFRDVFPGFWVAQASKFSQFASVEIFALSEM
jgi:hypothetical protein